jgi:hypothetical protein
MILRKYSAIVGVKKNLKQSGANIRLFVGGMVSLHGSLEAF